MRDLHELDRWRITDPAALTRSGAEGWAGDGEHGRFVIPSPIDGADGGDRRTITALGPCVGVAQKSACRIGPR